MFKKESHIELSDGGTLIVSNKDCPLSEQQSSELKITVDLEEGIKVPCCTCFGWIGSKGHISSECPNYFGYVHSEKTGVTYDCALLEPRKSMLEELKSGL